MPEKTPPEKTPVEPKGKDVEDDESLLQFEVQQATAQAGAGQDGPQLDTELQAIALLSDPDGGGEVTGPVGAHVAMPADDGGEIARKAGGGQHEVHSDPEGGGEIARKAGGGQQEVHSDPEGGGEVVGFEAHRTVPADDGGEITGTLGVAEDPDGGGAFDGDFGSGATPPRPVTMTADDLRSDPEGGGEVVEDPDAGGEVVGRPPLDGISVEDLTIVEDPDAGGEVSWGTDDEQALPVDIDHGTSVPPPGFEDLEVSSTFDEASHTYDTE